MAARACRLAVEFDELRIVHVAAECALYSFQICLVAVCREPDTVGEALAEIVHELDCRSARTVANFIGEDQFVVAVDGRIRPHVASALRSRFRLRDDLVLRVAE